MNDYKDNNIFDIENAISHKQILIIICSAKDLLIFFYLYFNMMKITITVTILSTIIVNLK
jgi:hypothetical protein